MSNLIITQCKGEGQGSCKMCSDNGIWNRYWMSMLYKIEGYEGCYCSDCVRKIREMNRMRLIDADDLLVRLRGNVLVDVTLALEEAIKEQPSVFGKEKPIVDQTHEIADMLETQANIELQKATSYHNGYIQACEDFGRALRSNIENKENV